MQASTKDIADWFEVSERTVANWVREGMPVVTRARGAGGNVYSSKQVSEWHIARRLATRTGTSEKAEVFDYTAERARLTYHQANIAELDAETKRGNLWPLETVRLLLQRIIGNGRAKLLALPPKFKNRVPGLEARAYELVETLTREAMDELAEDGLPAGIRESLERYHAHLAAAAEDDAEPVGDEARRDH